MSGWSYISGISMLASAIFYCEKFADKIGADVDTATERESYIFESCKLQMKNLFPMALKIKQLGVYNDHFGMLKAMELLPHVSEKYSNNLLRYVKELSLVLSEQFSLS